MKETKLVIILTRHPVLGVLLIPYTAELGKQNTIILMEQAFHSSSTIAGKRSEADRKAIEIASCYSEKNLMKVYSREKNTNGFLRNLSEKTLKEIVRPYIEKKLLEMITLIHTYGLPFYQKESSSKILFDHNACHVSSQTIEVSFHFEADESQFCYSLQCTNGSDEFLSFREKKPVITVISYPAVLLLGTTLMTFRDIKAS
ncbi:hypothetical protein EZS27_030530, partial [termite gut metagenome]